MRRVLRCMMTHPGFRAGGDVLHELITLEHTYLQIGGKYIISGEEALC